MNQQDPSGSNWTDQEIDLIVADYLQMLDLELAGKPYVKAERNRGLQAITGRSRGSIEFKHQNISAVLIRLGVPWIAGYKPMANFQASLISGVERFLDSDRTVFDGPPVDILNTSEPIAEDPAAGGFAGRPQLFVESPPPLSPADTAEPKAMRRLLQKFNPAARDERNRALGRSGESQIVQFERAQLLAAGRADLARKVRWVSEEDGDGAGYDIRSFYPTGETRLLEVKTTRGHKTTPFYISENERSLSVENPAEFRLVRLYDFARRPRAFEISPPLENSVMLNPTAYRASFGT